MRTTHACVLPVAGLLLLALGAASADPVPVAVRLEELDLTCMDQGWGVAHAKRSMDGNPLRLQGKTFEHGVGTHSRSEFYVDLRKSAMRFRAVVGIDDESQGKPQYCSLST